MRKGINLITKQKKYLDYENFFSQLRLIIIGLSVLILLLFFGFFFIVFNNHRQLERSIKEKNSLLELLTQNKKIEAEFIYFHNKQQQLKKILKEDVNFLPYYNLITESLKSASPSASLDKILITKERDINFTLTFDSPSSIINFLVFAESDKFLINFTKLLITQFNLERLKDTSSYQLNFAGKLRPIHEN